VDFTVAPSWRLAGRRSSGLGGSGPWGRTRWSGATLAMARQVPHGLEASAWTVRRWLHDLDGVWKRAKLVAKADAPPRVARLARRRLPAAQWPTPEGMAFADALDSPLVPTVGAAGLPKGPPLEATPPGQHAKPELAGARPLAAGAILHGRGARNTPALCRDLLPLLAHASPAPRMTRIAGVVGHDCSHTAKAVGQWSASHPRVARLWLPSYGPRANPLGRAVGDVHEQGTRDHQRKRLRAVVSAVARHRRQNGPWCDTLSRRYDAPAVTAAVERIAAAERVKVAA
jgi:hypothetical protein